MHTYVNVEVCVCVHVCDAFIHGFICVYCRHKKRPNVYRIFVRVSVTQTCSREQDIRSPENNSFAVFFHAFDYMEVGESKSRIGLQDYVLP